MIDNCHSFGVAIAIINLEWYGKTVQREPISSLHMVNSLLGSLQLSPNSFVQSA